MQKQTFGRRVNNWLDEPKGEIFKDGKWRFWFPTLIGLTALNAVMTAFIFGQDGAQKYIGAIVVLAGAVLCWLALGLLHYSDSKDKTLAISVAALDSMTLLFVAAHFSFLLWCQGHLWTLRAAETKYQSEVVEYNAQAKTLSDSNNNLAETARRIAEIERQTERLRNDTAYWSKKNGVKLQQSGIQFQWSTAKVELPPAPIPPPESSAAFLARWDSCIRGAGFGELALSIITLIFVRTRTSASNSPRQVKVDVDDEFPDELDAENRETIKRENFTQKKETAKDHGPFNSEGLKRLRAALKDISFRLHKLSFKANVRGDAVWILMVRANRGTQETVASAKAKLSILDDAARMDRKDFRERLEKFLHENQFEIFAQTAQK
jgi:hypothetical protein